LEEHMLSAGSDGVSHCDAMELDAGGPAPHAATTTTTADTAADFSAAVPGELHVRSQSVANAAPAAVAVQPVGWKVCCN
jgi:hypothetical protein